MGEQKTIHKVAIIGDSRKGIYGFVRLSAWLRIHPPYPVSLLRNIEIELRIVPGRSLLDQTGFTVAKVIHLKKDSQDNWLIGLEINRSQLNSSSTDFLLDP